jgi:general stress protein 26
MGTNIRHFFANATFFKDLLVNHYFFIISLLRNILEFSLFSFEQNLTFMTQDFLLQFISRHKLAVIASLSADNFPQSALVGIGVAPDLRIIFDTLTDSRKYENLIKNPNISAVIGWEKEATIQIEGTAFIPEGEELDELKRIYYQAYPHGWQRSLIGSNLAYFCIKPKWIRYADFNTDPPRIFEMTL